MRTIWGLAVAATTLAGCSVKEDLAATDAAVVRFHRQLDAGKLDEIIRLSAPEMKAAPSASMLGPMLAAVHRKFGQVVRSQRSGFNDQRTTAGHFVTVGWHTRFERGEGDERFSFKLDDGRPTLAGYNINAPALIVN